MFIRSLIFAIAALSIWQPAVAIEPRDAGIYLLVNAKGEVTPKAMRLSQSATGWTMEDRKTDGSWVSVSCDKDCTLQTSGDADIQRFFPAATLAQITPDCVHNIAFAFCGYALKADATFRGYLFVALVTTPPVTLRLARVIPDAKPGS
ncbi:hypothetical protein [Polaromonas sp. A23]|uniref:hypothetical protein n=1 Tax=Polaromonas sp. A23 TaxID=1944133 RepID=UPI00098611A1|nr:hypothetical protein [Polaromonas sp. A23]OOG35864.1 hypothetical protein B0B52_21350 [Polaromonas sp. A23]